MIPNTFTRDHPRHNSTLIKQFQDSEVEKICQHPLIDRLLPSDGRDEFGVREECCGVCGMVFTQGEIG